MGRGVTEARCEMFNLIVQNSWDYEQMAGDRFLKYADGSLGARYGTSAEPNVQALMGLPTLLVQESPDDRVADRSASLGWLSDVASGRARYGPYVAYHFNPYTGTADFSTQAVWRYLAQLGISSSQMDTINWDIKRGDVMKYLLPAATGVNERPTMFQFSRRRRRRLVTVMTPFDADHTPVWLAIEDMVKGNGWECERADSLFTDDRVMDRVARLVSEAEVVICDLSGRNANVFYETGLAHAIGKKTIILSERLDDVPSDMRGILFERYLPNRSGIEDLMPKLRERLEVLMEH